MGAKEAEPLQPKSEEVEEAIQRGYLTDSAQSRFKFTNDILAVLLIGFMIAATATYIYQGQEIPMWLSVINGISMITAVIWAFGKGAVKEARKMVQQPR